MHLNPFAIATLTDRYMAPQDNTVYDVFTRSIESYGSDTGRKERLHSYVQRNWFVPSTPVLANAGTSRGNPIACFLSRVDDSRTGILGHYTESGWLASNGGGIGSYWGDVRTIGERTSHGSQSNGMLPFQSVIDRLVVAFAQGSTRRASYAGFLPVSHPEINEFIDMRKPTGGDINRKNLNLHHGACLPDEFMQAVVADDNWCLVDPHSGVIKEEIKARALWEHILETRSLTGEPYMVFTGNMNKYRPAILKALGVSSDTTNLCTEITVATKMPNGDPATGVCCLGSLNLDKWDEFVDELDQVVEDCLWYLWHVLDDFISSTLKGAELAQKNAAYYRDVGLGTLGFHSYLQQKRIPFCSAMAVSINHKVFRALRGAIFEANQALVGELGECRASYDARFTAPEIHNTRLAFTHTTAIAPNASTSIFADASPGIEPWTANGFIRKTASGTYIEKNKYLQMVLQGHGQDNEEVWTDIIVNHGSVQHLDFLNEYEREVFLTAYEMDQLWIIQHAADRQPMIDQAQSVNLYFPPKTDRRIFNRVHIAAWQKGLKTLYYAKGLAAHKATTGRVVHEIKQQEVEDTECLACAN